MKIRKLLAFLVVCAMICCLFVTASVTPATALTANGKWGPSNADGANGWTAPTVDGFDGHARADSRYVIGTNDAYDLNVTTVKLNTLVFPEGQWASLTYSPEGKSGPLFNSDVANGKLCFLLQWSGSNLSVQLWNNGAIGSVNTPKADTYEIGFVISKNGNGTLNYGFRVNNSYTFDSWVATFCQNAGFGAEYVAISGIAGVDANVWIGDEANFVAAGTKPLDVGQIARVAARDGYQPIYGAETTQTAVGSGTKYDFGEKALYLADLWCGFYPPGNSNGQTGGHGVFLRFAQNRIAYGASISGTDSTDGLLCFNFKYATDHMELAICKSGQQPVIAKVPFAEVYQFRFDAAEKALCINGYFVKDGAITNFINSSYFSDSFISITGYGGVWTNAKVDDAVAEDWIIDKWAGNGISQSLDVSGETITTVNDSTAVATGEKKCLTETTLVLSRLDGRKLADVDVLMTVGYGAAGHIANYRGVDVAAGKLTFDFYILKDGDGNVTGLRPHIGGGNQMGEVIPVADTYKFNLVKIADTYYLVVNGIKYTDASITTFCNTYTDAYVSICSYANTLTYVNKAVDNKDAFDCGWVSLSSTKTAVPVNQPASFNGEYVRAVAGNSVSTIRSYNLLKEGVTIENPSASNLLMLNFTPERRSAGFIANSADCVTLMLERNANGYNVLTGWGNESFNGWYYPTNRTVPTADSYTVYAVQNTDGYELYINDTLIPIDALNDNAFTAFCGAGTVRNCYLSVSTNDSWSECSVRVSKPAWSALGNAICSLVPGNDNAANAYLPSGSGIRTKDAASLRNSSIILDGLALSNTIPAADSDPNTYNASATVIFSKNAATTGMQVASEDCICFVLRVVEGGEQISVSVISYYGGWEYLGAVPAADSYKIGIAYSLANGKYVLKVNNTVLTDDANVDEISTFCASDNDSIYALLAAFNTTVSTVISVDDREFAYGDVNQDFERDILDAVLVARAVAGEELDDDTYADADDNGAINSSDVAAIQQIIVNDDLNGFAFAN